MSRAGIVIIGRNEGERLVRCLQSVASGDATVVYVDSGSTDDSVAAAQRLGASVVNLDSSVRFSAARARNAGFARLKELAADVEYVQFIDGDCEFIDGWLEHGVNELDGRMDVGIVCGHTIERHPEQSIYNLLCDLEWRRDPGEIAACGGIFMTRAVIFSRLDGFRDDVIAAEDDEFCLRLRREGYKVIQLDHKMVWHDAAICRFSQWWHRARRAGHAYAQGAALHGQSPDRHFVRDCRRIWFWGALLPLAAIVPAYWTRGLSLVLLSGYALLAYRIYLFGRRRGWEARPARLYAVFSVIAKFPGLLGMLLFYRNYVFGQQPTLIEYKGADATPAPPIA